MKQMTCVQMGGPDSCNTTIAGNTAEEMAANGTEHVMTSHPEMAADMSKMTQEDKDKWMGGFRPKFDAAPEV